MQKSATSIEQQTHHAFTGLPQYIIHGEVTYAFNNGIRDGKAKFSLLMSGERKLGEALRQSLKLETAKAAAGPPARLRNE